MQGFYYERPMSFEDLMKKFGKGEQIGVEEPGEKEYYEDKTIIAGHIHTSELPDADPDMIYYGNGTIFMDCGSDKNGTLGCLCLDNGKEYYVR